MIHTDYFLFCFKISSSQSYSQHFCSDNSCETLECNESVLVLRISVFREVVANLVLMFNYYLQYQQSEHFKQSGELMKHCKRGE